MMVAGLRQGVAIIFARRAPQGLAEWPSIEADSCDFIEGRSLVLLHGHL